MTLPDGSTQSSDPSNARSWADPTRNMTWIRVAMIVLALLAPLAVVLSYRLSFEACPVLNVLGLPWPAVVKVIVRVLSAMIIVASTAGMVFGLTRRKLRATSIGVLIFSAVSVIPTFFAIFLTVYGDPGAGCMPA